MAASKKDVAKQQVKEDREKVREMYLSGKTVKEIAKETYFSSSYCYAMVRDLAKEKNFAKKAKRATGKSGQRDTSNLGKPRIL